MLKRIISLLMLSVTVHGADVYLGSINDLRFDANNMAYWSSGSTPVTPIWTNSMHEVDLSTWQTTRLEILSDTNTLSWTNQTFISDTSYIGTNKIATVNGTVIYAYTNSGTYGTNRFRQYDGSDDYDKISYTADFNITNDLSFGFFYKSDITNYTSSGYVLAQWDYATASRMWGCKILAGDDRWHIDVSADGNSPGVEYYDSGVYVQSNGWHSVGVYIANKGVKAIKFYHDGILRYSNNIAVAFINKSSFISIGGLVGANRYDGGLDNVWIASGEVPSNIHYQIYTTISNRFIPE